MNDAIELALKTWYPKDHPLHLDPLHPAIKLAGEAGEILDLYGKHRFKPDFNWWNCKRCGLPSKEKATDKQLSQSWYANTCLYRKEHTPLILDELGDWWYYWRILKYQTHPTRDINHDGNPGSLIHLLSDLNILSAQLLARFIQTKTVSFELLRLLYVVFQDILASLDVVPDRITELNYIKLNSDPTNHGWKGA